ncbi:hypothetical protein GJ496_009734 [Pomphorhynchus laevis]|nr:hypothetical protein GJ496_009734 [Pomphorhynchus laevis]
MIFKQNIACGYKPICDLRLGSLSELVLIDILSDECQTDFLNTFLALPIFSQVIQYNFKSGVWVCQPSLDAYKFSESDKPCDIVNKFVCNFRIPFYIRCPIYVHSILCKEINKSNADQNHSLTGFDALSKYRHYVLDSPGSVLFDYCLDYISLQLNSRNCQVNEMLEMKWKDIKDLHTFMLVYTNECSRNITGSGFDQHMYYQIGLKALSNYYLISFDYSESQHQEINDYISRSSGSLVNYINKMVRLKGRNSNKLSADQSQDYKQSQQSIVKSKQQLNHNPQSNQTMDKSVDLSLDNQYDMTSSQLQKLDDLPFYWSIISDFYAGQPFAYFINKFNQSALTSDINIENLNKLYDKELASKSRKNDQIAFQDHNENSRMNNDENSTNHDAIIVNSANTLIPQWMKFLVFDRMSFCSLVNNFTMMQCLAYFFPDLMKEQTPNHTLNEYQFTFQSYQHVRDQFVDKCINAIGESSCNNPDEITRITDIPAIWSSEEHDYKDPTNADDFIIDYSGVRANETMIEKLIEYSNQDDNKMYPTKSLRSIKDIKMYAAEQNKSFDEIWLLYTKQKRDLKSRQQIITTMSDIMVEESILLHDKDDYEDTLSSFTSDRYVSDDDISSTFGDNKISSKKRELCDIVTSAVVQNLKEDSVAMSALLPESSPEGQQNEDLSINFFVAEQHNRQVDNESLQLRNKLKRLSPNFEEFLTDGSILRGNLNAIAIKDTADNSPHTVTPTTMLNQHIENQQNQNAYTDDMINSSGRQPKILITPL